MADQRRIETKKVSKQPISITKEFVNESDHKMWFQFRKRQIFNLL